METSGITSQVLELLQGISKRLDVQDLKLSEMHEIVKRKGTRKSSNHLLPFKAGLSAVQDICTLDLKSTDNKVFIGLICCKGDEEKPSKAPTFSLTANLFMEFMEEYNGAVDGEKVSLPQEASFTKKYAEACLDMWQMPDKLRK